MSVAEIRGKAHAFERNIRVRNGIEYSAAVIVLISFGYQTLVGPNIYMRAGALLIVLATIFIVYFLHTRGSARNVPEEPGCRLPSIFTGPRWSASAIWCDRSGDGTCCRLFRDLR